MKKWRKTLAWSTTEILALVIVQHLLTAAMAHSNAVSVILSSGSHVPQGTLLAAIVFLTVRLVYLCIPGIILARLGMIVWDYYTEKAESR